MFLHRCVEYDVYGYYGWLVEGDWFDRYEMVGVECYLKSVRVWWPKMSFLHW
jgi:hypothetical protein